MNRHALFFNRVPKTGSENMVFILQRLAEVGGWEHKRSTVLDPRQVDPREASVGDAVQAEIHASQRGELLERGASGERHEDDGEGEAGTNGPSGHGNP